VSEKLEIGIFQKMKDISFAAGVKVIHAKDIAAFVDETFAEIGAKKTGTASDEYTFIRIVVLHSL